MAKEDYECTVVCNEKIIMPKMIHLVEEKKMSVRAAAQFIHDDSEGLVSFDKAREAYKTRKGGSSNPPKKPTKKQTLPEVKKQLDSVAKAIEKGEVKDDDIKVVDKAVAKAIKTGKAATRVGTATATAVKETNKKKAGLLPKSTAKSNLERLETHCMAFSEGLHHLADGIDEMEPKNEDDIHIIKSIRNNAPMIILNYARMGVDPQKLADYAAKTLEEDHVGRNERLEKIIDIGD